MVNERTSSEEGRIKRYSWAVAFILLILISFSLFWNLFSINTTTKETAKTEARANFNKDTAIRFWATKHGGVYVPLNERTPANPYLAHIPDRTITKPNGDTLTLMNPAYMIRQMFDEFPKEYGVAGRIVSLKPLNPNNTPDGWERKALLSFEAGKKESYEFTEINGEDYLRLMQPLFTTKGCLKCHAHQGYKEGDIRGGVGVSVPMFSLWEIANKQRNNLLFFHLLILLVGFIGIVIVSKRFRKKDNERSIIESELRKSNSFNRTLLNASPDIIYIYDIIEQKNIYSNNGIGKILGYSVEEIQRMGGTVLPDLMHPDDFDFYQNIIVPRYQKAKDEELIDHKYRIRNKHGNYQLLKSREYIFERQNNGVPQKIFGIVSDITVNEKSLKLQQALFRISQESSEGHDVNNFYATLHEIVKTLMPAKNFYIAIHNTETDIISFPYFFDEYNSVPDSRPFGSGLIEFILKRKKSQIIKGENYIRENVIIKNNNFIPKEWVGIYLKLEGNYKAVLALQDYENENMYDDDNIKTLQFISEQIVKVLDKSYADAKLRKFVKELFEMKEELELINKNKDRFFSIIAHDLRSPFMALMGISQMVSEDVDTMTHEEIKEMTSTIYRSTKNLNKLIENLLDWARLQMGTFEVSPKEISIKEISLEVVNTLKLSANEKNIEIKNIIIETTIYADEDCTKAILRNLVNNAIKFTERGGEIKLSSKENDDFVEIAVEDNGVGMTEGTLKRLFSITDKISEVGTEKEVGTGLGLILCKELVEKNNGKIWTESKLGKGSKFTFTLPKMLLNMN